MAIYLMFKNLYSKIIAAIFIVAITIFMGSCSSHYNDEIANSYNAKSYEYHYINLDSTLYYAEKTLKIVDRNTDEYVEAMNNIAFYYIAKMQYDRAGKILNDIAEHTDNQIEQMISRVQLMRICQRKSDNKNFYHQQHYASSCMKRIVEDYDNLTLRQRKRFNYAQSEYWIVLSTYLYYIGQPQRSSSAIFHIADNMELIEDVAQTLAFYYNVGSGGVVNNKSHKERLQIEFDYLIRCYMLSRQYGYVYWEANSLQALSEHLQSKSAFQMLSKDNADVLSFLNSDQMSDSLLAGNLAERALKKFNLYGDVYQIAGAWRTLAEAYNKIGDNQSALVCLDNAIHGDTIVNDAPDLVASIREQMSIVYSALNNKQMSDYNRNIYLDMQEYTRQDRQLEARAEQLASSLRNIDIMIVIIIMAMVGILGTMCYLYFKRRKNVGSISIRELKEPIEKWKEERLQEKNKILNEQEEIRERIAIAQNQYEQYQERNIEQRAKVQLASSIAPLINRMVHEIKQLPSEKEQTATTIKNDYYEYVWQLATSIEQSNRLLTNWIQLRKGEILLHIESFRMQDLFDAIKRSDMEFRLKGISLIVKDTDAVVKADKALTLFMVNTISENAKRYTQSGGIVDIFTETTDNYVEVSVKDDGCGMNKEQLDSLFKNRVIIDKVTSNQEGGHGFGLINCKGIIEKYRKISSLFSVCDIGAESVEGQGSRIFFRLPKGIIKTTLFLLMSINSCFIHAKVATNSKSAVRVEAYTQASTLADSMYNSNVAGNYVKAIDYAKQCMNILNSIYAEKRYPHYAMKLKDKYPDDAVELKWHHDSIRADYDMILALRNEIAVAALALHDIELYTYNNQVYTKLFRECSADNTLPGYVKSMQKTESNRNIAFGILAVLFIAIFPAYYFFYYRYKMCYRLCLDRLRTINEILLKQGITSNEKLKKIKGLWGSGSLSLLRASVEANKADKLQTLVEEICECLKNDIKETENLNAEAICLKEELKGCTINRDRIYVLNNILDNCLSSLKHETMFYPSRLKQIIKTQEANDTNTQNTLDEVASFYQTLYSTLLLQTVTAMNGLKVFAPKVAMAYLLAILKRKNGGIAPDVIENDATNDYVRLYLSLPNSVVSAEQASLLFTSATIDTDFLVCRQVMRDIGEYYRAHGCGIDAKIDKSDKLVIEINIKKGIWKNLKLS